MGRPCGNKISFFGAVVLRDSLLIGLGDIWSSRDLTGVSEIQDKCLYLLYLSGLRDLPLIPVYTNEQVANFLISRSAAEVGGAKTLSRKRT